MRTNLKLAGLMTLLFLMGFIPCIVAVTATVSISGEFHNPDNSLSIFESNDNANSAGSVSLMPYSGYGDHTFSIKASGNGVSNTGNATTEHFLVLKASGDGKTVVTRSMIEEDAGIKPFISESWSHGLVLGSAYEANGGNGCALNQMIDIKSKPGYLTFPTSASVHPTTTTRMTLDALDANGHPLFDTKNVPPWREFGEPRLTLAAWPEAKEYSNVYMENILEMSSKW